MQPKPILKGGTRTLRPSEYEQLHEGAKTLDNRTLLDTLLLTGLRFTEARLFQRHLDWFDSRGFVHLPINATRKVKRRQRERWVKLSNKGTTVVPYFFKVRPLPTWKSWTEDLERWAGRAELDPTGLSPKSTRKSFESWLISTFPERTLEICLSMGHTQTTSLQHYVNMPFNSADKECMKEYVHGWER